MPNEQPDNPLGNGATLDQVRRLLKHHLHTLWSRPDMADQLPPLMLWGPPGVGKSTLIRELCAEEGVGFIDVRLAQREPVDLRGLPVPKDDAVHWLPAAEWPRDPDSRGIILFDELTAADRALQVAAYEFILDRRLGDLYRVPEGWYICAAGNRTTDRAVAVSMSSALANRFCHIDLEPDLQGWTEWATGAGIHPTVIAFLRFRPECFFDMDGQLEQGWPSPRTWERASIELYEAERAGLDTELLDLLIRGLVGPGAATEFSAFRDWADDLPDARAMLEGRAPIQIPQRADQRYALCAALVHILWNDRREPGADHLLDGFFRICEQLPSDFAAMAMIDALTGPTEEASRIRSARIFDHPGFIRWTTQHGQAFADLQAA
jgi:DNA polymerase III delta prime subunit